MKGNSGTRYRYDDKLIVPIIENTPFEIDLEVSVFIGLYIWQKQSPIFKSSTKSKLSIHFLFIFISSVTLHCSEEMEQNKKFHSDVWHQMLSYLCDCIATNSHYSVTMSYRSFAPNTFVICIASCSQFLWQFEIDFWLQMLFAFFWGQ